MFFMKKIAFKVAQRQNDRAEEDIVKYGYQEKNQYLISQGFSKVKKNLKALLSANGDEKLALQILSSKQSRMDSKIQLKQEKKEMKSHIQEEKSKIKSANKLMKYQIKLQKMGQQIEQLNLREKINQIQKMGYDNQVKVAKVLIKFNGDTNKTVEFIQKKSYYNNDKFKLAGLGIDQSQNQSQVKSSDDQQQSVIDRGQWFENSKQTNYNYPPPPPPPPNQYNQSSQMQQNNQYPQNMQNPFQYKSQEQAPEMVQSQQKRERKPLKQNNNTFEIPKNIDVDAYQQMMVSKQEEIKNIENNSSTEEIKFKDEDVEIYIKKNEYLITQGFKKADKNIEILLRCNGDEYIALQQLKRLQQEKEFKKGRRGQQQKEHQRGFQRGKQKFQGKDEEDNSSSSSFSDD